MTGTELVNIIKSPTSKVLIFGTLLIGGALILIPMLNRDDNPDSVKQETELKQEEKAPLEIGTGIPRFKLDKRSDKVEQSASGMDDAPPPVINENKAPVAAKRLDRPDRPDALELAKRNLDRHNDRRQRTRKLDTDAGRNGRNNRNERGDRGQSRGNAQSGIFIMSATSGNSAAVSQEKVFLSERYAPFGRLLDCKLVNTLESNTDGTPLIALVIEDLWWTNANGERKLIIPAGTEVHGKMGSCVRNRMMCEGNFVLIWQITSDQVGMELQLQGRILEKSNQAGNKGKATITDMAAGIPGRVMKNDSLNEMLQYTMAFAQGLASGFQTTTTYDNGSTIVSESDGSTKNALASGIESLSDVALENITDKISKESYYIRVAAGTEFYLYIEQVTDISKAAIADTALNNLEQLKLSQNKKNNASDDTVAKASKLHDALGSALPKSLKRELKGIN